VHSRPGLREKNNGRLYRYYVPVRENNEHAGASGLPRLPAGEQEAAVLEPLRRVLRSPAMIARVTWRGFLAGENLQANPVISALPALLKRDYRADPSAT